MLTLFRVKRLRTYAFLCYNGDVESKGGDQVDIAAMSMVNSQAQVKAQASLKVMANVKDVMNQQGEHLIEMLQTSNPAPHPTHGNKVDVQA